MQRKTVMPIPPATKTSGVSVSSGSRNVPFGCSTSTSVADRQLGERLLNAESRSRVQSPSTPWSFGEVTTEMCRFGPFSSSYGGSRSVTQKYWPAWKSTRLAEQVEDDEQRPLRDLALLRDLRSHVQGNLR